MKIEVDVKLRSVYSADGPTRDQAAAPVADLLEAYPAIADRRLSYSRRRTPRAYAARAMAAARTGDLAEATSHRLAYLAELGVPDNPRTGFTAAEYALATGHPDRDRGPGAHRAVADRRRRQRVRRGPAAAVSPHPP